MSVCVCVFESRCHLPSLAAFVLFGGTVLPFPLPNPPLPPPPPAPPPTLPLPLNPTTPLIITLTTHTHTHAHLPTHRCVPDHHYRTHKHTGTLHTRRVGWRGIDFIYALQLLHNYITIHTPPPAPSSRFPFTNGFFFLCVGG